MHPVSPKSHTDKILSGVSGEGVGDMGEQKESAATGPKISTEEEEVELWTAVKTPYTPTAPEVAEHRVDHATYRDWCEECVEAFGREDPHRRIEHRNTWVPVISCDYMFLSGRGVFTRQEGQPREGSSHAQILLIVDSASMSLFAHAVPQKGVDESGYVVDCFATDVAWLGWSRVIIRSDNEPAIAKLVVEAIKALKVRGIDQAAAEGSVPYDPQRNGAAEAAAIMLKGIMRALHMGLEKQIGARVPATHPLVAWLARHAA